MDNNILDLNRIGDSKIIDFSYSSDEFRDGAMDGICAKWATIPPFYVKVGGMPMVIVGRYADVKAVYFDEKTFTPSPPDLPGYDAFNPFKDMIAVAQMTGPDHHRVRRLMNPSFSPATLGALDDSVQQTVAAMLDEVESLGGPFECMGDFADDLVVRIVLGGLLGISRERRSAFVRLHKALSEHGPGDGFPDDFPQVQAEVMQVITEIVAERRATPRENDFVSALVSARYESDGLSDSELLVNLLAILGGGLGTTSTATGTMLLNLCRHRDQFEQVIANRSLIPLAVEECLRFQGSLLAAFPRFATRDVELGGTLIPRNMPVQVCQMAANLDPDQYPDPLRFDINRNPKNIMSFGLGAHHCLGNRLARRVMCIVLEQVCERFPGLHLQDPQFKPSYPGATGDLRPASIPMHLGNA